MAPQIILAKDFDIKNVSFSDVKMLDNGGKIVYVSYNRAPFFLQTPTMPAPFGLSSWDGGDGKSAVKYSLDLSFKGMDASPSVKAFYGVLEKLDRTLLDHGFANQANWFKGKRYGSREIVEALYTPLIKFARDKTTGEKTDAYPPTFKASVPFRDGDFACDVFDATRKPVRLSDIDTKGSAVTAIIQCTGVWFAGGKFGVSWKIAQMKVVSSSSKLSGFALRDDDDDDAPQQAHQRQQHNNRPREDEEEIDEVDIAAAAANCVVSSSDDSEEEENDL